MDVLQIANHDTLDIMEPPHKANQLNKAKNICK